MQGRFGSADEPLVDQDPADPQSWNLYGYVRNNPLRYIDPMGRECVTLDNGSKGDDGQGKFCKDVTDANQKKRPDVTVTDFEPPTPLLLAVARGAQQAGPVVNVLGAGTGVVMAGAIGGIVYSAWAGGAALTTVSIPAATLPPLVSNPALQRIVNKLFQVTDKIPGGTAGAVRYELATGELISPAGHSGKAGELIVRLTSLLKSGTLTFNDQIVCRRLIQELSDALKTQPRR